MPSDDLAVLVETGAEIIARERRMRPLWTSSSRVQITLTGLPAALAISTASTMNSSSRWPRRPKPPPNSVFVSFTCLRGILSTLATASCAMVWLCVPHQISHESPDGETEATAFNGSICA